MNDNPVAEVAALVGHARHLVVLTGAGISTDSGIPDFRGPNGVWTKNPEAEKTATLQYYVSDPAVRVRAWRNRVESNYWTAEPNNGHRALAAIEQALGPRFDTLITQNIDGLHHAAGSDPRRIVEIHGNVREVKCLSCDWRAPMETALERVRNGEEDPSCPACAGILKSATISFGENLVAADLERCQLAALRCDLFVAAGTSLGVYPAAALPELALQQGAKLVVFNAEPTPFDRYADVVVSTPLSPALQDLAGRLNRDDV